MKKAKDKNNTDDMTMMQSFSNKKRIFGQHSPTLRADKRGNIAISENNTSGGPNKANQLDDK